MKSIYYSESDGYGGWHMPSINELSKSGPNRATVNATLNTIAGSDSISNSGYWSSSESDNNTSYIYEFHNSRAVSSDKNSTYPARAVKWF